ncbi:hypothetical protein [Aquimonas voraii]|uniref:Uncharacterized protein n=1 Tax=Aquimonas voraii TaxID=265719 RepID=A0A1G6VLF8_9GAMM|nr:hypothetical protein [Aquimonas voraii]SDD53686.1 hypothetical protein SAMN04488509_103117 [Aquimonas voraii]
MRIEAGNKGRGLKAGLLWLWLCTLLAPVALWAQSQPAPGYVVRLLDGQDDFGEHLAVTPFVNTEQWTGFHYLANERALYAGPCGDGCAPEIRLTDGDDRGRFVSAARRGALTQRPFAAFYNATRGDLEAVDCFDSSCNSAILRVLDTVNDVGVGTATAIDPATGFPFIAYYDATNGDLRLYRCASAACDSGSSIVVDGLGDRGRNPTMAFANTALWIAYDDSSSGELRLARGVAPFGAGDFQSFSIGPGGDASITLEAGVFVDLVFRGGAAGTLERLRCTDIVCGLATQSTLIGAGRGFAPSATRLPNGNLLVSHHQPAAGALLATVCNDASCSAPQRLILESGPGFGPTSVALAYAGGRPLIQYQDAVLSEVRSAQCTTTACTALIRRIANGVPAFAPDVAVRADGRPVAIWTKLRRPRIGVCADRLCSSVSYRETGGFNADASRPSIAIRPDGRPFAYYSSVGGSAAWDCADADCSTGTHREVSGSGNGTGDFTELAIRPDGRPLMLYMSRSANTVHLFSCADVNCSSGQTRLLADEPDPSQQATSLSGLGLAIGSDGRPVVTWSVSSQPTPSTSAGALRVARCDDIECSSATVHSPGTEPVFNGGAIAVRADHRPVLLENTFAGARNLLICADASCSSASRIALPNPFDVASQLVLRSGDVPAYGSGTLGSGGWWQCSDAACASSTRSEMIRDSETTQRSHVGRIAFGPDPRPVGAFAEQQLWDVWLALPVPVSIFANGFEP